MIIHAKHALTNIKIHMCLYAHVHASTYVYVYMYQSCGYASLKKKLTLKSKILDWKYLCLHTGKSRELLIMLGSLHHQLSHVLSSLWFYLYANLCHKPCHFDEFVFEREREREREREGEKKFI